MTLVSRPLLSQAVGNLLLVLFGYAALTVWLSHTLRGIRLRNTTLWTSLLVIPVLLLGGVGALLALHVPMAIGLIFPVALGVLCGLTILLSKVLAPQEPVIPTRETKPSILHLVLISGSALFLIPFVWMVGTSLKSDAQLVIYPAGVDYSSHAAVEELSRCARVPAEKQAYTA